MKRVVLVIVALALLGLFGWQAYRKISKKMKAPGGRPDRMAVAVEVAPVRQTAISDTRQFSGSLAPRSQFVVAPKVAGRLEKLLVDLGDDVKRNQLIAALDSQEYEQAVEEARAELKVARANIAESESALEVAKRELERTRALREKKIAPEAELDEAEAAYKTREARHKVTLAQVEQKEAALKAAEVRLSFTQIRAAWEGGSEVRRIGERYVDQGVMLRANDPIVSILEIDSLTAVIEVTEENYARVRLGQSVRISTDAQPDREFTATIVRISPALKESSRTARVEALINNQKHLLKPGLFIRAEIEVAHREGATVVPLAALTTRDEKSGVFLLEPDGKKVHFVPVETGIVNSESAEILAPKLEGRVVTLGHHLLEDGSPVLLPESDPGRQPAGQTRTGAGAEKKPTVETRP
ncbi:MAG TPA: efflux RND transporter periplasmic adaptor subunit [bacterium]|uniref:Multidrug resistance protein MdtA n=1 Tax=candidate division TA06 bacterium ADurb.Bin417 TaxID=1852828 RepID=A0A1V5MIH4_UNCT6|nr:MAG: Multidrug resistance protein MdtA precursor [candidate division TA06 bacterium ADurb.Bin417]HNQ35128.1 efflux RND transporter periplasmic adaptor subunit [bacterium]HNS48272.1 efflux RND transporter periplasmic adaptor subunit [bacterium]